MKNLNFDEFNELVLNTKTDVYKNEKPTIVDFYADWCQPCKNLARTLEELEGENNDVNFYKVNIEDEFDLAVKYQIRNVPVLLFISNNETKILNGNFPKNKIQSEINDMIKSKVEV